MSMNWVADMAAMHQKFGVNPVVRNFDKEKARAFLEFRIRFLQEELDEMVAEIQRLFESGEYLEKMTPVDLDSVLENLSDEEIEDLMGNVEEKRILQ